MVLNPDKYCTARKCVTTLGCMGRPRGRISDPEHGVCGIGFYRDHGKEQMEMTVVYTTVLG